MAQRKRPLCKQCEKRPVRDLPPASKAVPGKPGYEYTISYGYNPAQPEDPKGGTMDFFCSAECGARYARTELHSEMERVCVWCLKHGEWEGLTTEEYDAGARCIYDDVPTDRA